MAATKNCYTMLCNRQLAPPFKGKDEIMATYRVFSRDVFCPNSEYGYELEEWFIPHVDGAQEKLIVGIREYQDGNLINDTVPESGDRFEYQWHVNFAPGSCGSPNGYRTVSLVRIGRSRDQANVGSHQYGGRTVQFWRNKSGELFMVEL